MNSLLRCLPCFALAALAACSGDKSAAVSTAPATPPVEAPQALTDADVAAAVRAALDGDFDARYFDAAIDLNGDGSKEVLAYVAGPMVCGTGGCPLFVFTPGAGGYDLVAQMSVVQLPVRVSSQVTQGWRDLVVSIAGGGIPASNAILKFDGKTYPSNPTVPPAELAASQDGTEILIGEFGSYTEGKPLNEGPATARVLGAEPHSLEDGFWKYYRDDSIHSFYGPGSQEEVRAFASPPWESSDG